MNILVHAINVAGIFSKWIFVIRALVDQSIDMNIVENIHFDIDGMINSPFSYVVYQQPIEYDKIINARIMPTYKNVFDHSDLPKLRELTSKIIIKDSILNEINSDIDDNTIGIHIRLTDMNVLHTKDHGHFSFDDYKRKLDEVIKIEGKNKIFVASDNIESIEKLKKDYNIIYNKNISNRHNTEENGRAYNKVLRKNRYTQKFWEDTFIEMYSLSRCGYLIKRVSSLNTLSVIFAKKLKKVYPL